MYTNNKENKRIKKQLTKYEMKLLFKSIMNAILVCKAEQQWKVHVNDRRCDAATTPQ